MQYLNKKFMVLAVLSVSLFTTGATLAAVKPTDIPEVPTIPQTETVAAANEPVTTTEPTTPATRQTQQQTAPQSSAAVAAKPVAIHKTTVVKAVTPHVSIPSIGLNAPIVNVGIDDLGRMDVPDGNTNNVGWYSGGTAPGEVGSAVLDAHVFAALKNLHKVQAGDSIYVTTRDGRTLNFIVRENSVYKLADVPAQKLFNRADGRWLNLITCAGTYDPATDTYTHRTVVYAELVS
jgi:sortase (surface protein transpeptidase)